MNFKTTIGHDTQKKLFQRLVGNGRLAHAYALVGDRNIGKTTFAREFAKILGADPVLDIFALDAGGDFPVEEIRKLKKVMALAPVGKCKAAILSNAEALSRASANALLKLLEEPAQKSYIFLTVSNFAELLPTIASRIQKINFGRSGEEETRTALQSYDLSEDRKKEITAVAAGRIGLIKKLAEDEEYFLFLQRCRELWQALSGRDLAERLLVSEEISKWEDEKIRFFLEQAAAQWCAEGTDLTLGKKLLSTWQDLNLNLNKRLLFDNLFVK